jgi:aspartate dehydrogenase
MKTVALVGCGSLGGNIAGGIQGQLNREYKIVGLYDSNPAAALALSRQTECPAYGSLSALLELKADYVIEAATSGALKEIASQALRNGSDLIVLSAGAFADEGFASGIREEAGKLNRRIYIPSGAIGGFDIMQAAMALGQVEASIYNIKSPEALEGAPYLKGRQLSRTEKETIFTGNAREAIEAFPKNVNVAVALSLATAGPEKTKVMVVSVPGSKMNTHRIELAGDFGSASIEISSWPSLENPKSSEIAAYSVIAKLKNLSSAISFC